MSQTSSFTVSNPMELTSTNGSSQDAGYCTTEEIISLRRNHRVKDGIKRLTAKYDSIGKFGPMTGRPPSISSLKSAKEERERLASIGSDSSSTLSHSPSRNSFAGGISEHDLLQIEMFYRSHKTEVHVCPSLANLYFGKAIRQNDHWKFAMTGIPVLVLDTGIHHRDRKLHIVLAEKGTGFVLWRDKVDQLTAYKAPHANFHTLHLSTDHTKIAGLSFDDKKAASEFVKKYLEYTSDPDDELLKLSKGKKKKVKQEKQKTKFKPPKKTEISQPCCFVHVTKLENTAMENLQNNKSIISGPVAFENLLDKCDIKEKENLEISSILGSKLTINSDASSIMSEDPTSVSSFPSDKGSPD